MKNFKHMTSVECSCLAQFSKPYGNHRRFAYFVWHRRHRWHALRHAR